VNGTPEKLCGKLTPHFTTVLSLLSDRTVRLFCSFYQGWDAQKVLQMAVEAGRERDIELVLPTHYRAPKGRIYV